MANSINNLKDAPGYIAKMAAAMFANKVVFCKSIEKEPSSNFDGVNGYNSGDTIQISKPARFIPGTSADITSTIQDINEEKVSLTLDTRKVVPIALTSKEIVTELALKNWAKRVLEPAVSSIAQHVDQAYLEKAVDATSNLVGTPGTSVFDTDLILSAGQKIEEFACPEEDNRFVILTPAAMRSATNARKNLFQSSEEISKQYKKGYMGEADGFNFLRSNLLPTHTNGNDVTGVEVSTTVSVEGQSTLVVEGLDNSTGTVTKGSVFTIAGVNAVNPITKQDLGYAKQWVVTADVTANGSGIATLSLSEGFYTGASDGLQNITAFPADGDAMTFDSGVESTAYAQNLAYHKSAFRMVSVPLVLPDGLDMGAQETVDDMTIRVIRDYDVLTDKLIMRLDYLGGFSAVRPEWACRITS